jgi:hypothetical protein
MIENETKNFHVKHITLSKFGNRPKKMRTTKEWSSTIMSPSLADRFAESVTLLNAEFPYQSEPSFSSCRKSQEKDEGFLNQQYIYSPGV